LDGEKAGVYFDKIVANAQSMRNLSKVEGFVRSQTPGYRAQLHIFEVSADEIIRQAKQDNVDGAALAFTQLTISCVNCHKHLRADAKGK
jgi:cytochrome c556